MSAVSKNRPAYRQTIETLQSGDVFVVSSLDRAFRSYLDALSELDKLQSRDIKFISLVQNFDTTTSYGKFLYSLAAALATWDREILSLRTKEGLDATRKCGKKLGRPRKLNSAQILEARRLLEVDLDTSTVQLAQSFSIHEDTLKRALGLKK